MKFVFNSQKLKLKNKLNLLLAAGFSSVMIFGTARPSYAADITFQFSTSKTGTAPFTSDDNPGNDSSETNNIVRTLDIITYKWDYAVNNGDANNTVLTATISSDQEWTGIPPACNTAGSSIAINPTTGAQTLTCDVGKIRSGSNGFIEATARVIGQRPDNSFVGNGDIVTADGTFTADGTPTATDDTVETIVSATPKADLRKPRAFIRGQAKGRDGTTDGLLILYPINIVVAGGKGSEPLVGDINITDTFLYDDDDNTATPPIPLPSAEIYNWRSGEPGCGWLDQTNRLRYGGYPYGRLTNRNGTPYSTPERAAADSGTWTCTQSAAGQPININITGANTTGNHVPTRSYNNQSLPANMTYLVSGVIELWVPTQVVLDNGGDIRVTNRLSQLDNKGVSGQTNNDPTNVNGNDNNIDRDGNNNEYTFVLIAARGNFNQYYANNINQRGTRMPEMTRLNSGDGPVMPTQNFTKRLYGANNGVVDWEDYKYCEKFDNRTHILTPLPDNPASAVKVFNVGSYRYVIEYGTGDENGNPGTYSSYTAQRQAICEDDDSADGWFTDMRTVPGGVDKITKIRFRALDPVPPNARMDLAVNFTARNFEPGTTTKIPDGTILANFSAVSTPTLGFTQGTRSDRRDGWYLGSYNPETHGGSKAWGDRLFLTRAIVRIDKETSPNDSIDNIRTGDTVTFALNTSVNSVLDPAPVNPNVVVRDILPKELTYIPGSASLPPTSVTENPDGTTTILWDLGQKVPNQPIPQITFDSRAKFDVPNNTDAVNTAIIESPDDGSPESTRTDRRTVTIGNVAAFGIFKDVEENLIEPENVGVFKLLYANTGTSDVGPGVFIDALPYPTDGRIPATTYQGTMEFASITGSNGETFEFTKVDPSNINPDPNHPSNQSGGSTIWCTQAQFGNAGCPANNAEITGTKMFTPPFPQNTPTREVVLTVDLKNNERGNIYTNNFSGRVEGLIGLLQSNDVSVYVRLPTNLLLIKRITAINGNPINNIVDDPNTTDDNNPNWPNNYLKGNINGGKVKPGDSIEYTVYFLSNGDSDANNVNICDLVPPNTTFIEAGFNGSTPVSPSGLPGASIGIALERFGNIEYLTSPKDGDKGSYLTAGTASNVNCFGTNDNGAVIVNIGNLSRTGFGGTPSAAYGLIRFVVKVQ